MGVNEVVFNGEVLLSTRGDTVDSNNLFEDERATDNRGEKVFGLVVPCEIDDELNLESTNPVQNKVVTEALENKAYKSELPTKVSDLENDLGFISDTQLPTNVSELVNDAGYVTDANVYTLNDDTGTIDNDDCIPFQDVSDETTPKKKTTLSAIIDFLKNTFAQKTTVSTAADGLAPKITNTDGYLKGDGTWSIPQGTTYDVVSTSANGLAPKITNTDGYLKGNGTWSVPPNDNTIPSAYCTTAAATKDKTASCTGYELLANSYIQVVLVESNSSQNKLTLSINSKTAKDVYINGTVSSSSNYTLNKGTYLVYYNGTNYYFRTDGKVTSAGMVDIGGNTTKFMRGDGTWQTPDNTTYDVVSKTANGLCPQLPNETTTTKFLRQDGGWQVPPDTTYSVVSKTANGLCPQLPNETTTTKYLRQDGSWQIPTGTTYNVVSKTANGLCPQLPNETTTTKYLRQDGTWVVPPDTTYGVASKTANGLCPQLPNETTTTKFLRQDGSWQEPPNDNTDTKVTQTATTTSANYEVLFSATADNTTRTEGARKNTNLKFNPSTGNLQATQLNGVDIGSSPKFSDTWTALVGATSSANGSAGYVGATPPKDGYNTKFLRADGTWSVPEGTVYDVATTTTNGLMSSGDKTKTDNINVFYGTCSTAAATAAKVVTLTNATNFALKAGAIIGVKFTVSNTASSVTLDVDSKGAKSIWYNNAAYTGSSTNICGYANRVNYYMYDGTYWVWMNMGRYDGNDNTVPSAYCATDAATAAKTATCTGYALLANSYIHVIVTTTNTVKSALTLSINGKDAKPIYINGSATSASNYSLTAGSYLVYYNGTNYYFRKDGKLTTAGMVDIGGNTGKYFKGDGSLAVPFGRATYSGVLATSDTTVTITGLPTSGNHIYDIYVDKWGLNPTAINDSTSGQITITFPAQSSPTNVYVRVEDV